MCYRVSQLQHIPRQTSTNVSLCVSLHWITKDVSQAPTQHAGLAKYDTVSLCSHSSLLLDRGLDFTGCVMELRFYTVAVNKSLVSLFLKAISVYVCARGGVGAKSG